MPQASIVIKGERKIVVKAFWRAWRRIRVSRSAVARGLSTRHHRSELERKFADVLAEHFGVDDYRRNGVI